MVIQVVLSALAYFILLYFTPRKEFIQFFSIYTILFASYYVLYQKISIQNAIGLGIFFRIIALFSIPELSDDFYRFIWDGMLTSNGINPYVHTPKYVIDNGILNSDLTSQIFKLLNSPNYYAVYPPLNQLLFKASNLMSWESSIWGQILALKFWLFFAEIGTLLLLPKVLKSYEVNPRNAILYALNPLVIIELTGNAHFEAIMILMLLFAIYFFKKHLLISAIFFGLSISIKLIPILFIPLLWQYLKEKKWFIYFVIVAVVNAILFIPFLTESFIENFGGSIQLYFKSFQFNSFVYPIVMDFSPLLIQKWASLLLMAFPLFALSWFSFSKTSMLKNLPAKMGMAQSFYYFFAAVIHPWYLSTIIMLTSFHPVKYILVWSYVIGLSYFTYRTVPYEEAPFLVALEYVILFTVLFIDWIQLKRIRYRTQT